MKASAPAKYRALDYTEVCGISAIYIEIRGQDFDEPLGTLVYLVEAGNGEAIEIPERHLEPYE
ncbi:MAG: hypothetical protein GY927_14455 [bacterium]|nr:hypothetical protein [bacterium]